MGEEQRNRWLFYGITVAVATLLALFGAYKKLVLGVEPENKQLVQESVPSIFGLDPMMVSALWPFSLVAPLVVVLAVFELHTQIEEAQNRQLRLQEESKKID